MVRVSEGNGSRHGELTDEIDRPAEVWELHRRGPTLAVAAGGLAAVLAGCGTGSKKQGSSGQGARSQPSSASGSQSSDFGSGDVGIVNFALTLEATIKTLGAKTAPRVVSTIPLRDEREIVQMAAMLENIGASAYLGQAGRVKDKNVLTAALSIHAVEARHAAVLNTMAGNSIVPDGAFARASDMDTVLLLASPFMKMANSG